MWRFARVNTWKTFQAATINPRIVDHEININVLAYYSRKDIAAKSKNRESLLVQLLDTALTFTHANPLGFFPGFQDRKSVV